MLQAYSKARQNRRPCQHHLTMLVPKAGGLHGMPAEVQERFRHHHTSALHLCRVGLQKCQFRYGKVLYLHLLEQAPKSYKDVRVLRHGEETTMLCLVVNFRPTSL